MIAIKNGTINTITKGIIKNGTVLIDGGKIKAVGTDVKIPEGAKIINARGKYVMPGLVEAHGHISVEGAPRGRGEITDLSETSAPNTAYVRAVDALNPRDASIAKARTGGVTTVCTLPGSANICGGEGAVFKTKDGNTVYDIWLPECRMMKFALGENPKGCYNGRNMLPKSRLGNAAFLREILYNAKVYSDALLAHEKDSSKPAPKPDFRLDALVPVVRGEMKARIHCHRADDIVTAIRISKEFGLKFCLEHVSQGHRIADYMAKEKVECVVGPICLSPYKDELHDTTPKNAALLDAAGNEIAIMHDGSYATYMLRWYTGVAMANGLPEEKAFRAVTIVPARILGIEKRVGSIEVGKDADIAIFNGHPFSTLSLCEAVLIDGELYENK